MESEKGKILVVDDDQMNRVLLTTNLEQEGYLVEQAEDGQEALNFLREATFDLVLLDLLMPGIDGFQVLKQMKSDVDLSNIPIIVISVLDEMESVVRCIEMGATDHLPKPFDPVLLHARINACLEAKRLHDNEREYLRQVSCLTDAAAAVEAETFEAEDLADICKRQDALGQLARVFRRMALEVSARQKHLQSQVKEASKDRYKFGEIIGKSDVMQVVYEKISQAADSDANVMVLGDSGTGKELVAETIHKLSHRSKNNFVPVNCGAIPEALFEREFFGHCKGTFTGADRDKPGFFDHADGGTLFLDEVSELPIQMQVKLLRVLQSGEFTPLGSQIAKQVNVRIIAATNKDVSRQREQGLMRDDFFYRLYVIVINLPPLKERKEDIPLLIEYFLRSYGNREKSQAPPAKIMDQLVQYEWPGNVRELQNTLQRYIAGEHLDFIGEDLSDTDNRLFISDSVRNIDKINLRQAVESFESKLINNMIKNQKGQVDRAADKLEVPLTTLYRKIKKYELI